MYVCVCNAVTDRQVGEVIAGGARTRLEVTRACGAGGDCGACHGMIESMLEASGAASGGGEANAPGLIAAAALRRVRAA